MTTLASLDGRSIDTARLSGGDLATIQGLHGAIRQGDNSPLRCLGNGGSLYVARIGDGWFLRHFAGGPCGHAHRVAPETDDHKRGKAYIVRAAESAGLSAFTEAVEIDADLADPAKTRVETRDGGKWTPEPQA